MDEREALIQELYWEYTVDAKRLLKEMDENNPALYPDLQNLFVRAFESMHWEDVVHLFGRENIHKIIEIEDIPKKIRPQLRSKYNTVKDILQGKPIVYNESEVKRLREAIAPFLSNRWYRYK